jgi:2-C-methyl-D-erythritol 2,4-cyclodiphosphate synthase
MRIGIGQDSHRLMKTKHPHKGLVLAGITIRDDWHFSADSDGDVIIHSLCNALSSAIASGSLDSWAGKMNQQGVSDSKQFLKVVLEKIAQKNLKVINVSIALEGQEPKIEKYSNQMKNNLAEFLKINTNQIGITATTGQDLTPFGQGLGVQAISMVLLDDK